MIDSPRDDHAMPCAAISRRRVLIGSAALFATSFLGSALAQKQYPGVATKPGGT